jgi:hypothetical protein
MEDGEARHGGGLGGGGEDLISALPEDFLLQILVRLELHGLDLAFPGSPPRWLRLHLAPSIELRRLEHVYTDPRDMFPALERLSLSACSVDLTDLVLRCPRLRVLREADGP